MYSLKSFIWWGLVYGDLLYGSGVLRECFNGLLFVNSGLIGIFGYICFGKGWFF